MNKESFLSFICLILILGSAVKFFYCSPYEASEFELRPDAVEYSAGAYNIVTKGHFCIDIGGREYPPRYSPWFSLFVLSPVYLISSSDPGNVIYAILFFSLAGGLFAFFIGKRISGLTGGIAASGSLFLLPLYGEYCHRVMTDLPCAAVTIFLCWLYILLRMKRDAGASWYWTAGLGIAFSYALRPLGAVSLFPFLLAVFFQGEKKAFFSNIFRLVFPLAVLIVSTLVYQYAVFGTFFRNGYQYWCSIPLDYFFLSFSWKYVLMNLRQIFSGEFLVLSFSGILLMFTVRAYLRSGRAVQVDVPALKSFFEFLIFGLGPVVVFYLFYFFPDKRFFLPLISLLCVLTAALISSFAGRKSKGVPFLVLVLVVLAGMYMKMRTPVFPPISRALIDFIAENTPEDSLIVTGMDPVYFGFMTRNKGRRSYLAVSRNVEYASKLIVPEKHLRKLPEGISPFDHRYPELSACGAEEAVFETAQDNPQIIESALKKGRRVFLDLYFWDKRALCFLLNRFKPVFINDFLCELR